MISLQETRDAVVFPAQLVCANSWNICRESSFNINRFLKVYINQMIEKWMCTNIQDLTRKANMHTYIHIFKVNTKLFKRHKVQALFALLTLKVEIGWTLDYTSPGLSHSLMWDKYQEWCWNSELLATGQIQRINWI